MEISTTSSAVAQTVASIGSDCNLSSSPSALDVGSQNPRASTSTDYSPDDISERADTNGSKYAEEEILKALLHRLRAVEIPHQSDPRPLWKLGKPLSEVLSELRLEGEHGQDILYFLNHHLRFDHIIQSNRAEYLLLKMPSKPHEMTAGNVLAQILQGIWKIKEQYINDRTTRGRSTVKMCDDICLSLSTRNRNATGGSLEGDTSFTTMSSYTAPVQVEVAFSQPWSHELRGLKEKMYKHITENAGHVRVCIGVHIKQETASQAASVSLSLLRYKKGDITRGRPPVDAYWKPQNKEILLGDSWLLFLLLQDFATEDIQANYPEAHWTAKIEIACKSIREVAFQAMAAHERDASFDFGPPLATVQLDDIPERSTLSPTPSENSAAQSPAPPLAASRPSSPSGELPVGRKRSGEDMEVPVREPASRV